MQTAGVCLRPPGSLAQRGPCAPRAWGLGHCRWAAGPAAGALDGEGPQASPADQAAADPDASTPQTCTSGFRSQTSHAGLRDERAGVAGPCALRRLRGRFCPLPFPASGASCLPWPSLSPESRGAGSSLPSFGFRSVPPLRPAGPGSPLISGDQPNHIRIVLLAMLGQRLEGLTC